MVRLGFVGFGEAGFYMSQGLGEEGVKDIRVFDVALASSGPYKQTVENRAKEAGVTCVASVAELARDSDIVICAVPAQHNESAALSVLPHMRPDVLYVDVTSSSPMLKEKLAAVFAAKGFRYVDSAMMGALPNDRHKVPMCCSGDGAKEWVERISPWNMKGQLLEGPAGMASKVKLTRSAFMKGLQALCDESFLLARKLGIEDNLMRSLAGTFAKEPVEKMFPRFMAADAVHAERRMHEAEESAALMEAVGIVPAVCRGAVERMRLTAAMGLREELGGKPPKDLETLFGLWETKGYK